MKEGINMFYNMQYSLNMVCKTYDIYLQYNMNMLRNTQHVMQLAGWCQVLCNTVGTL